MYKRLIILLLLMIPVAAALESNYDLIVEENGNALVIIEVIGTGLLNLTVPDDVIDIRVKGALYAKEDENVWVSIGSTQKAIVAYKTALLTKKHQGKWYIEKDMIGDTVSIALPLEVEIESTNPLAMIQRHNFTSLSWQSVDSINIVYSFPESEVININDNFNVTKTFTELDYSFTILIIVLVIASVIFFIFIIGKRKSSRPDVIKTLTKNEKLIVKILLENDGAMKRNKLEKLSKFAKSSLAHTLNMLERKNIIEIDKTYAAHYIKITRWFHEL